MTITSTNTLADDILTMLRTGTETLKVYDGEIPADDPPDADDDGRVGPYAVFYAAPGQAAVFRLCGTPKVQTARFQVTAAGGTREMCLWVVDLVRKRLSELETSGGVLLSEDIDPGSVTRQDSVTPPRHYVPMKFRADA